MKAFRFLFLLVCYSFAWNSSIAFDLDEMGENIPLNLSNKDTTIAEMRCSDSRNPNSVLVEFERLGNNKSKRGEALYDFCKREKSIIRYDSLESIIFEGEIFNFASDHTSSPEEKIMTQAIADWWFQQALNIMQDTILKNKNIVYTEEFYYLIMRMRKDRQNVHLPAESYTVKVTKDLLKGEYGYVLGRFNNGTNWKLKLILFSFVIIFMYFFLKGIQFTIKSSSKV